MTPTRVSEIPRDSASCGKNGTSTAYPRSAISCNMPQSMIIGIFMRNGWSSTSSLVASFLEARLASVSPVVSGVAGGDAHNRISSKTNTHSSTTPMQRIGMTLIGETSKWSAGARENREAALGDGVTVCNKSVWRLGEEACSTSGYMADRMVSVMGSVGTILGHAAFYGWDSL